MRAPRQLARLLPRRSDYAGLRRSWRGDVVAGLTVAVVALPLALAFGVSSGLGAAAGLTTSIVAGLVAAFFGGSNLQVSGPTGAMTVVLVPLVATRGPGMVAVVGLLAGVIVVAAAVARLGRFLAYIPWPVVEGFTIGIAIIIFLQQVPAALGVTKPEGENTALVAVRSLSRVTTGSTVPSLVILAVVVVVMLIGPRLHRGIPASLAAVVLGTLLAEAAGWEVARIGVLPSGLPHPTLPSLDTGSLSSLVGPAVAVAALAAIESLLSAKVADGMIDGPGHDPDRELFGQGLANIASPLFGGMPATGAIARTAVNARAGARTRVASMVHAGALVLVVVVASGLVARIPLAVLAGVLMVTAYRMADLHAVRSILRSTRSDAVVLVATAAATVVFDLIVAVEIGLAVAAILALRSLAGTTVAEATPIDDDLDGGAAVDVGRRLLHEHIVVYRLDGALFFGAAQRFLTDLAQLGDVEVLILRMPDLQMLDATGAQALGGLIEDLEHRKVTVLVKGPRPEHERILRAVGALDHLASERHLFTDLDTAVAHARDHVRRRTPL